MGISDEERSSMLETEYLLSIPGMKEQLDQGVIATIDDCDDFDWDVPIGGAVWDQGVGLPVIDFFAELSGVLTPKSNALFDFLAKSVMYDDDRIPLNIDYSNVYIATEVLENSVLVSSRHRIVDSVDSIDLGAVSICYPTTVIGFDSMGLNFYAPSYEFEFEFWQEEYRFTDEYRFHYHIDFKTRTFELYCRPEDEGV